MPDDATNDLTDLLEEMNEAEEEKKEEESETEKVAAEASEDTPKSTKPKEGFILLQGLEIDEEVKPPEGFAEAKSLKGRLGFLGGRKHDSAKGKIAMVKGQDGVWHYVGNLPNMLDSPKLLEWLSEL